MVHSEIKNKKIKLKNKIKILKYIEV